MEYNAFLLHGGDGHESNHIGEGNPVSGRTGVWRRGSRPEPSGSSSPFPNRGMSGWAAGSDTHSEIVVIYITDGPVLMDGFECPFGTCNDCDKECVQIPCG